MRNELSRGREAGGERAEKQALEDHDKSLLDTWSQLGSLTFKLEYHSTPVTKEQQLENKLSTIFYIGEKLKIVANGLTGYHCPVIANPSDSRIQNARQSMVSVIVEGKVRPAGGYTSDLNPTIDQEGNVLDGNEQQAFCAPLRRGSYFDSSGDFGPYWVIFQPDAVGSDRYNGIPARFHQYYLVPGEIDREFIKERSLTRGADQDAVKKIITYDEFIELHQSVVYEGWAEDRRKSAEEVEKAGGKFSDQAEQQRSLEGSTDMALVDIARDPEESIQMRHTALLKMTSGGKEVTDTCLHYLRFGNEQGQKLAMHKLTSVPLLDPGEEVLQAVNAFRSDNIRADTGYYINRFLEKFSYITQPDKYEQYAPKTWEDFARTASLLALDWHYGKRDRVGMKKGLFVYLLKGIRSGEVQLADISDGELNTNDILLGLEDVNDIGLLTDTSGGMQVDFGGWGIVGFQGAPLSRRSDYLKKIVPGDSRKKL